MKILNLSSKNLNNFEIKLLNRGLKFVPTPKKPDLIDLEIDIKEFIRKLKLREHFYYYTSDEVENLVSPPSDWTPLNFRNESLANICKVLKNKSETLSSLLPVEKITPNISYQEQKALSDLMSDHSIVIKPADKGNVVVILDKDFYRESMLNSLNNPDNYIKQKKNIDNSIMTKIKKFAVKFSSCLTYKERIFITNFNNITTNIYGVPKIHKSKQIKEAVSKANDTYLQIKVDDLTFRKINGGTNSPTSRLSTLLDKILKPFLCKVPSYIKDSTDFLNKLERFDKNKLKDVILVTIDVVDMYPSIPLSLGIEAIKYFCQMYPELIHERFNENFIIEALHLILENNLCHFDGQYFSQKDGIFTGTPVAVPYSILTLAYLEVKLLSKLREKYAPDIVEFIWKNYKRFLDDGFIPWMKHFGPVEVFIDLLNQLNPKIKFVFQKNEEEISFLNVLVYKGENSLMTDIFYKETDSKDYLPFNSCHEHHTKINIPFTLSRMICTIVEDESRKETRLTELKFHLIKCGYPMQVISEALTKAKSINQNELRQYKEKKDEDTLCFVSTFNPRNPNAKKILNNTMESIYDDPILNDIFKKFKFIKSSREPKSLGDFLTKSYFHSEKPIMGVNKCLKKKCKTCPSLLTTDHFYFHETNYDYKIYQSIDCTAKNVIYVLICKNCDLYYIGKTVNLRNRMTTHRAAVRNYFQREMEVSKHMHECSGGDFWVLPIHKMKYNSLIAHLVIEDSFILKYKPTLNSYIRK